ncbi:hypothetical protein ACJRO7_022995 [Eucalyptus globulus]|uniref:Peptidase A1 domain-containing protein n=1 Tax=Eucalyptus globulus TaxID=34317 RepID=A0ABD3K581_EUCGL
MSSVEWPICHSKFTVTPETMAKVFSLLYLLFYFLIFQNLLCYAHSKRLGLSLKFIPRFSPQSPLYPGNLTWEEKLNMAAELSISRAYYLYALSSKRSSEDLNNIHLRVHEDSHYYAVELKLGTPAATQVMLMDTGSGLMWTQCQACKYCFRQTIPIFTQTRSVPSRNSPVITGFAVHASSADGGNAFIGICMVMGLAPRV